MGAKIDVVCKRGGKEAQKGAEKEGGAHRGQSQGAKTPRASKGKVFGAHSPDRFQFLAEESRQKWTLTRQVDTRDIFFQLASESRDLQSHGRKEKLFGEDMIHFYSITKSSGEYCMEGVE